MKKLMLLLIIAFALQSCGTILFHPITECQKNKPAPGEPKRKVRPGVFVFDIFGAAPGLALIIDFYTGAIYKPCPTPTKK